MGIHDLIPTMRKSEEWGDMLCDDLPTYVPWQTDEEMEQEVEQFPQHATAARYVAWDKNHRRVMIHEGPRTKLVKIEDWMLAIRQYRSRAKAEGYRNTGINFYNDLIRPVIEYGRTTNVDYVVLVVDKGSPSEKEDTQKEREAARQKAQQRRQAAAAAAATVTTVPEGEGADDKLPTDMTITDDGMVWTTAPAAPATAPLLGTATPGKGRKRVRDEGTAVSAAAAGAVGVGAPLDVERLFRHANRSLRIQLYHYIRECMSKDTRFYRVVNGQKVPFGVIFDYDLAGPWRFQYDPETKRTTATQVRDRRYCNDILEADLACFWWASKYASHDVFIHAGDTDYIVVALLNAHRFKRSLLIQIRAHDRLQDPVCFEALYARYHLHAQGTSVSEFALGCALQGNDFVKKSWILPGVGVDTIHRGVRFFRDLRTRAQALFVAHEDSDRQLRLGLERLLTDAIESPASVTSTTTPTANGGPPSGGWVSACIRAEWPQGIDALICCIYLLVATRGAKGRERVHKAARNVRITIPAKPAFADWSTYLGTTLRPILDAAKPTSSASANGHVRKKTALPPVDDAWYVKGLERVRFVMDYWATLQGSMEARWE
jgi:hypothetical protein